MSRPGKILLWGSNLWMLADGMLGPLFAVFAERIGGSILDISWAWSLYLIVTGVGVIVMGRLSDRVGKEMLMLAGYALAAFFTFGYLLVSAPAHLLVVQAGMGLALALAQPTWFALYHRHGGDREDTGFLWGLPSGMGYIVSGVGLLIGGAVVTYLSFPALFVIMGTVQTLATLYVASIMRYRLK